MKQEIKIAKSVQQAIPEMDREESTNYYVIIGEGEQKVSIGIGKTNYQKLQILLDPNNKGAKLTVQNAK